MIMKKIITYFLLFNFLIGYSFDICAETLTDIEMENKSLQTEIDSIKAKIATLENNPSDDPACDSLQSEFATVKSESKEADEVYATGTETIKSLDKQIESLEKREKELDVKIKKHKNAQMATGILGGVFGAGAIGLGLWSHFEKKKIASGEYTDPKCVSTIFNKEKERIYASFDRESGFGARTNDLIADVGANCASCCPGKVNECEKESDALLSDLDKKLKELKKPTDDYSWESICDGMMKSNLYANLQDVLNAVKGRNELKNDDVNRCVDFVRSNYGDIAVAKTNQKYNEGIDKNRYAESNLQYKCAFEFCSRNNSSGYTEDNRYCLDKCYSTDFRNYIFPKVFCADFIYLNREKNQFRILKDACSMINEASIPEEKKNLCFDYIRENIVRVSWRNVFLTYNSSMNCEDACTCSMAVRAGDTFTDNYCIKACNDFVNSQRSQQPVPEPKEVKMRELSLPNKQTKQDEKKVEQSRTYCEDITFNRIQTVCRTNPYVFKGLLPDSPVNEVFKSRLFQQNDTLCTAFRNKLSQIEQSKCHCYLGSLNDTKDVVHFDCTPKKKVSKYDGKEKDIIGAEWHGKQTTMKIERSDISEEQCINLYKKKSKSNIKTDWCD